MDSSFIQKAVQKWLFEIDHIYQALNFKGCGYSEADILAITRSRIVTEVEVKISKADYKADFKKEFKHDAFQDYSRYKSRITLPNRFYFAVPIGMITEVPVYAGLLYVTPEGKVECMKGAPWIHREKPEDKLMIRLLENLTAKTIWGCQWMTEKGRRSAALYDQAKKEREERQKNFQQHLKNIRKEI